MRDFAKAAKRAAKFNPAWKQAKVYEVSKDEGVTVFTDDGDLQFDLVEETFGFLDRTKEEDFTTSETYEGDARLTVLSIKPPNAVSMISLDDTLYVVHSVISADVLQATIRYACTAISDPDTPTIRTV